MQKLPVRNPVLAFVFLTAALSTGCGDGGASSALDPAVDAGATARAEAGAAADPKGAGPEGGVTAAPSGIEIVNLSYTQASATSLNFVLENDAAAAIESLEAIEIRFEGESTASTFAIDFAAAGFDSKTCRAWVLAPGESSPVIELPLHATGFSGHSGTFWMLDVPCSIDSFGIAQAARDLYPSPITPAKPGGRVSLRLRGLLANGAPWSSEASGEERK